MAIPHHPAEFLRVAVDVFLHLDRHLNEWAARLGPRLNGVLFLVVFCETGLVVTPYLPGDSLLFAIGALSTREGSPIHLPVILALLCVAAVAGDAVNYWAGWIVGPRVFSREDSWLLNKKHLLEARRFYEKYGGKTIVLARFVPVVRTFAPFVAGIGRMRYGRFAVYNVAGGVAWVATFLLAGHRFADLPVVRRHFHYVILAIVVISVIPAIVEYLRARRESPAPAPGAP